MQSASPRGISARRGASSSAAGAGVCGGVPPKRILLVVLLSILAVIALIVLRVSSSDPLLADAGRLASLLDAAAAADTVGAVSGSGGGGGGVRSSGSASSSTTTGGGLGGTAILRSELSTCYPLSIWEAILESASSDAAARSGNNNPLVAVEVGVHTPTECIKAATMGFTTHCFEPSPKSFARLKRGVDGASPDVRARLVPHQEAAGPTTGDTVPFHSTGGTGDHVGEYDFWRMERHPPKAESAADKRKAGEVIHVPTVKLDDFIRNDVKGGHIYLLKVDTQGFEPSIFSGLTESIRAGAITYVIFEFWPRGMDLMADTRDMCSGHKVLDGLMEAGYALYPLAIESHPKAPLYDRPTMQREAATRPLDRGTEAYCRWFFDLERRYPNKDGEEEYRFGYWSDFVAVAPGAELPEKVLRGKTNPLMCKLE